MDFGDLSDNPFAVDLTPARRPKRQALVSAAKFLLLVVVCLAVTVIVGSQTKKWLAYRLTHDFDVLSAEEKQSRLVQIADLDLLSIKPLVDTLADEDISVARTAYDLLRQSQNDWTALGRSELERRHALMVDALQSVAVHLPDDRTGWGTSLLQQTLMTTIDRREDGSRTLFHNATHAMEMLSLSDRAGPSILSDEPLDPLAPKRLTVQSQPLPVSTIGSLNDWTDWPPPNSQKASSAVILNQPQAINDGETEQSTGEMPSVYRSSSARLQPVQSDDPVILRDVHQPRETAFQTADLASDDLRSADIQSVTHLVDSPMETFDDKSVVHWLGSPHQALRDRARVELISRGYNATQLAIAKQLASGDTKTRLDLVDGIARSTAIDPRPWLLMMLQDESRDVKLRVISVLATMNDPGVSQRLRTHLVAERDPTVAARIRRVLDLR